MTRTRKIIVAAGAVAIAGFATFFAAAAVVVTEALHPARHSEAEVCPCLAHVTCREVGVGKDQSGWYFFPDKANGGAILMLHGIGATREDMMGIGAVFLRSGYSILVPDLRGFGRSGGSVGFGAAEARDIQHWSQLLSHEPGVKRLYGFGVSLGGSALLESLDYDEGFRAVVAESAFSDFPTVAKERARRLMPARLGWATGPFVNLGFLWAKLRFRTDLGAGSAAESVRRSRTPVLLVHGLADEATLPDHSRRIAAANPAATELWLIPKAAHANAWATAGKVFEDRVLAWYAAH